jgi:hypothetical protein
MQAPSSAKASSITDMLPAELRLMAYSNLIPKDFKGGTEELKGILLSCKLLHEEVLHELTNAFRATLKRTLASVTSGWNAEFNAPLRITQSGSKIDELSLSVEIPGSILRNIKTYPYQERCHYDEHGYSRVFEIIHPVSAFRFKGLTISIYQDAPSDRREDPEVFPLLFDLITLMHEGTLGTFDNSTVNRHEKIKVEPVLARSFMFD